MRNGAGRRIWRSMYKTYELYMEGPEGPRGFEPVTCRTEAELLAAAQRLIDQQGLAAVEVRHFGAHVFTVAA